MDFLDLADFRGHVYPAHGRHSGSSAMPRAEVIDKIQLKNKKIKIFRKRLFFRWKILFERFWKIENFKKSRFSKIEKFEFFIKVDFFENFEFFKKNRKSDFLKFSIFQNLSKNIFHGKNKQFFVKLLLSYLMYNLSEWHRGTPTVPPVGAVNVPAENQKIHIFEDFLGHFFLINYIGFWWFSKNVFWFWSIFFSKTQNFQNKIWFLFLLIQCPRGVKFSSARAVSKPVCGASNKKIVLFSPKFPPD